MNKELKTFLKKLPPVMWLLLFRRRWILPVLSERQYQCYKRLGPDQYQDALKKWYKKRTGKTLNLENPQTYNEKIQWLKLYDSTPLKAKLADKYLVREWVAEKIGREYLIPLFGVYDKFDDIDFDALPNRFIIKVNLDGGANQVVTDKSKFDIEEARNFFNQHMRINYLLSSEMMELHYKDVVQKILIEDYLENSNNDLYDYKFMCFEGKVQFIVLQTERHKGVRATIFNTEWERMPFNYGRPRHEEDVKKPDNLEQMIKLAEVLAAGFSVVRVDFFRLNDGTIKFGELVFSPNSGTAKWNPPEYDKIIGDYIKLPEKTR